MSKPNQTVERLRNYLNGNQPLRERMCTAILPLLGKYENVTPRRPEGGPDGGRDIEAIEDGMVTYGGVGFQNNVSDSPSEIRIAFKKFKDDVASALKAKNDLKSFVFFTNVDLTPNTIARWKTFAQKMGITKIEIFHRERIRMALDSPEGFAARFQYLDIPLSDPEQRSFFARWGSDIQSIIRTNHQEMNEVLDRLETLTSTLLPLKFLICWLKFKPLPTLTQREHFRIYIELSPDMILMRGHVFMMASIRDSEPVKWTGVDGKVKPNNFWDASVNLRTMILKRGSVRGKWKSQSDSNQSYVNENLEYRDRTTILFDCPQEAQLRPYDFIGNELAIYMTPNIAEYLLSASLGWDLYGNKVWNIENWKPEVASHPPGFWNQPLSPEEAKIPWLKFRPKNLFRDEIFESEKFRSVMRRPK